MSGGTPGLGLRPGAATDEATGTDPRADLRWGTVPRLLADVAARLGGAEALVDGNTRRTFAELAEEVAAMARALVASGVAAGDRVAVWAPNCAEWAVAALGTHSAGAVVVPLNTRFKGGEAAHVLRASGARMLCTVEGFLGVDYPGLLAGEDLGELAEVVVLRREGGGNRSVPRLAVPVTDLADLLAAGRPQTKPRWLGGRPR